MRGPPLAARGMSGYRPAMSFASRSSASPVYQRDAADPRNVERALQDLQGGMKRLRLAVALARLDIRNRYRGSVLGPFWLTLSTAIMVTGIGILYSALFRLELRDYLPFLAVSLIIWGMLNQTVQDACNSLINAEGIIRQLPLPYSVHVLRFLFRNAIIAAHSLPLIALVLIICGRIPGPEALLSLVGLALLTLNAFAGGMFLGIICARFRDIGQIVANAMQLVFFLSPVLWKPQLLGHWEFLLPLNPVFVLMETVRGPLVSGGASLLIWGAAFFYTAVLCTLAFLFFVRFRGRIAFWV
jgi:lipopolysaccharide transport system permease protein